MAFAKINKAGCKEFHGNIAVQIDFFLEPDDPRYAEANPLFHSHRVYLKPDFEEKSLQKIMQHHLANFYLAFQNERDKTPGGMRHGWDIATRKPPVILDRLLKAHDYQAVRRSCENRLFTLPEVATIAKIKGKEFPATLIDVGPGATNRGSNFSINANTGVAKGNPANASGKLDYAEVFFYSGSSNNFYLGTFSASGNDLTCHDSENVGSVPAGNVLRTFSGLYILVDLGEYLGCFDKTGNLVIENDSSGGVGKWWLGGEHIDPGDSATFTLSSTHTPSLYATGDDVLVTSYSEKMGNLGNKLIAGKMI
ncbi:MAG: hypothetical protein PHW65_01615 [Dehalococcoidales bacterium]|nr:hypothetical protein [Dehalococcoidales bacterium]